MQRIWDEVAAYVAANAHNPRKGYRLGELTDEEVLSYAALEMFELTGSPDDVDELADLLGCLVHYAQRKGWSPARVEEALVRKLALRFPEAARQVEIERCSAAAFRRLRNLERIERELANDEPSVVEQDGHGFGHVVVRDDPEADLGGR